MEILASTRVCEEYRSSLSPHIENALSDIGNVDAWFTIHCIVELYWKRSSDGSTGGEFETYLTDVIPVFVIVTDIKYAHAYK